MKLITLLAMQAFLFPAQNDIFVDVTLSSLQKPWAFIAPHENEHIANEYVAQQVKMRGGTFVVLRQHGNRHIKLKFENKVYEIDPNRIFTDKGRKNTLGKLNPSLIQGSADYEKALQRAESLANFILKKMDAHNATSWIALHNNTNGYDDDGHNGRGTVSIKRYQKKLDGGSNYLIKVHDAGIDEDDLFFITSPADFDIMANANWNVILQNPEVANDPSEDDGSLSVLGEIQSKRYVNIEAEREDAGFGANHLAQQKAMVDLMFTILEASEQ